jgi:hypothetical protein
MILLVFYLNYSELTSETKLKFPLKSKNSSKEHLWTLLDVMEKKLPENSWKASNLLLLHFKTVEKTVLWPKLTGSEEPPVLYVSTLLILLPNMLILVPLLNLKSPKHLLIIILMD